MLEDSVIIAKLDVMIVLNHQIVKNALMDIICHLILVIHAIIIVRHAHHQLFAQVVKIIKY